MFVLKYFQNNNNFQKPVECIAMYISLIIHFQLAFEALSQFHLLEKCLLFSKKCKLKLVFQCSNDIRKIQ